MIRFIVTDDKESKQKFVEEMEKDSMLQYNNLLALNASIEVGSRMRDVLYKLRNS